MRLRRALVPAIGLVLTVAGCGPLGRQEPLSVILVTHNFSGQPFSLHAHETPLLFLRGRGTSSLVDACSSAQGFQELRPPFDVRFGPGRLEDTGDGSGVPVILTDADFIDPDIAWIITVDAEGEWIAERVSADEGRDAAEAAPLC